MWCVSTHSAPTSGVRWPPLGPDCVPRSETKGVAVSRAGQTENGIPRAPFPPCQPPPLAVSTPQKRPKRTAGRGFHPPGACLAPRWGDLAPASPHRMGGFSVKKEGVPGRPRGACKCGFQTILGPVWAVLTVCGPPEILTGVSRRGTQEDGEVGQECGFPVVPWDAKIDPKAASQGTNVRQNAKMPKCLSQLRPWTKS